MKKIVSWIGLGKKGLKGVSVAKRFWHQRKWLRYVHRKKGKKKPISIRKKGQKGKVLLQKSKKIASIQYKIGKQLFFITKKRYY